MQDVLTYAAAITMPLLVGAYASTRVSISKKTLAVLLAFAAGSLIAALAYDLFAESFTAGGIWASSVGLLVGAGFYIVLNNYLSARAHAASQRADNSLAPLATAGFDGIPESLLLGASLASGNGSVALLVAIMVANVPESFGGAESMRQNGYGKRFVFLTWLGVAIVSATSVWLGYALLNDVASQHQALLMAFAAGGLLAAVADNLLPEAYDEGGSWVAFATAAGFLLSFLVTEL